MKYVSAGESHGKALAAILEGIPANLHLDIGRINNELARRQKGYGRGGRMQIETDKIEILSGVRGSVTTGAPIAFLIANRDYENNAAAFDPETGDRSLRELTCMRPGHADYAGTIKYNQSSARNILERASARETAARVAAGAIVKQYLEKIDIFIGSHVTCIAGVKSDYSAFSAIDLIEKSDASPVRCMDKNAESLMIKRIDLLKEKGDTAGGEFELIASGMPVGIGSHIQYDRKLDYLIMGHLASLQAVKSVGIGIGYGCADVSGSETHDEMYLENGRICRKTNRAGGIEGGISNGENIIVRAAVKAIPTLMKPLNTVDIKTMTKALAESERSDVCAVPAAAVAGESILAFALGHAIAETLGGDFMEEVIERMNIKRARRL